MYVAQDLINSRRGFVEVVSGSLGGRETELCLCVGRRKDLGEVLTREGL